MAPTTRKTRATAKAKQLLEDNAPEDASSSTTLAQPNVSSMNQDSTQPNSSSAHKRKRLTNSSANGTLKKPRLQTTASAPVLAENNLKDSVREGLILISIGLNPGIMTGKTGHAYAHPSNRYWPTLHASGITPIQHKPSETHSLTEKYGLGHTNIIPFATVGGNSLTPADYAAGAEALDLKIRRLRPQAVMIVGKGIWEEWFRYKKGRKMNKKDNFQYGWQDPDLWIGREDGGWEGARSFVVTTTSGLSSSHTKEERVAIWKPMGDWFTPKREQWVKDREGDQKKETDDG